MKKSILLLILSGILSYNISYSQAPTDGLIASYPFNGNANDISGNNNNGVANNVTYTVVGFNNTTITAAVFNGSTSNIVISPSNSLNIYTAPGFSWSFWSQVFTIPSSDAFDLRETATNSQYGLILNYTSQQYANNDNSNKEFQFGNYSSIQSVQNVAYTSQTINLFQWYHIVVTVDQVNNKSIVYLNGVKSDSSTVSLVIPNNPKLTIGSRNDWHNVVSSYYNGLMANVNIYNRVLTPTEIATTYCQYSPSTSPIITVSGIGLQIANSNNTYKWNVNNATSTVLGNIYPFPLANGYYQAVNSVCNSTSTGITIPLSTNTIGTNCPQNSNNTVSGITNSRVSETYFIEAYPNPSTGEFRIIKEAGLVLNEIAIYDSYGKLEEDIQYTEGMTFKVNGKGLYLLKVYGRGNQLLIVEKIIVE